MALKYIGKHIWGNSTKCEACRWYRERSDDDKTATCDGWCERNNAHRKESWNSNCSHWVEAETGLMYYEAETGKLEPCRTPLEVVYYTKLLKEGTRIEE